MLKNGSQIMYDVKRFRFQINTVLLNFLFRTGSCKKENQHIRMISEGSCDTEDWSNDAEYSALPSQE